MKPLYTVINIIKQKTNIKSSAEESLTVSTLLQNIQNQPR